MNDAGIEERKRKAKQKRYKKPIHGILNLDQIGEKLIEISEACGEIQYAWEREWDADEIIDELIGGEDEAKEFKIMFSDLSNSCDQMLEDLNEEYIPEFFDVFFALMFQVGEEIIGDFNFTGLLGYDEYEQDYFGISDKYDVSQAVAEAQKKIMRYTKQEILDGARKCYRIAMNFVSLVSRYEDLKASMDILRNQNKAELNALSKINELYRRANDVSGGFKYTWYEEYIVYEKFIDNLDPYSQMWLY